MPITKINEIDMHYTIRGNGPPLLMIMGWQGDITWWPERLLKKLEAHYRLVLFDNRGSGKTEAAPGYYSIPLFARDAVKLLDTLHIERAHVLGVSMGGMIAQEIALEYPERVGKLILGCTSCSMLFDLLFSLPISITQASLSTLRSSSMDYPTFLAYLLFDRNEPYLRRLIIRKFAKIIRLESPNQVGATLKQSLAILFFNRSRRLRNIQAPTLVITGTRDLLIHPRHSEILTEAIPNARLVKLEGQGHAFFAGVALKEVYHHLVHFLEEESWTDPDPEMKEVDQERWRDAVAALRYSEHNKQPALLN